MRYALDTNACIALLNETSPVLSARARAHPPAEIGLPAPVVFELYYGAYKSTQTRRSLELLAEMSFETIPFDTADARVAGSIRNQLEAAGRPIGPYDILIAGQALARGLILVTANTREFQRVGGLDCENWLTD